MSLESIWIMITDVTLLTRDQKILRKTFRRFGSSLRGIAAKEIKLEIKEITTAEQVDKLISFLDEELKPMLAEVSTRNSQ
jgi:hypothetical protein